MPRLSIFAKTLRELRWQVFWYGLGLALMSMLVVYIYPSYSKQLADFEIPPALQALIGNVDYGTAKGFVSAEVLSWVPLVLVVFAINGGTSTLAGEEANGTLDLLLAQPISRTRLALEKLAGLLVSTLVICAITYTGWLASVPFVDIQIGLGELLVATLNLMPLIAFFQLFSAWAGVALPTRGMATGLAIAVAVVSYFVNFLANLVDVLKPARSVSVFYHYHGTELLTEGVNWGGLALLVGLCLLFGGLTLVAFQRRDLGVRGARLHLRIRLLPR